MSHAVQTLKAVNARIPEFCLSHWLLRLPLTIVFIQQGLSKFPVSVEDAHSFELPYIVWWFAAYGELGGGIGLLIGGVLLHLTRIGFWIGDTITRFSGFTIGCIMTGVIWVGKPESLIDVLLHDNLHVFLWLGGLFFALRGNHAK